MKRSLFFVAILASLVLSTSAHADPTDDEGGPSDAPAADGDAPSDAAAVDSAASGESESDPPSDAQPEDDATTGEGDDPDLSSPEGELGGATASETPELDVAETLPETPRATNGRVTLRLRTEFLGSLEQRTRATAEDGSERVTDPFEDDLEVGFGGSVHFEVPLSRHFGLGFQVGAVSWTTNNAESLGRSAWYDLDLTLRVVLPAAEDLLEAYLFVPAGLFISRFSEGQTESEGVRWGHAPGFKIAPALGLAFNLGGHGLFLEAGYTYRRFSHGVNGISFGTPVEFSLDATSHQMQLATGFFWDI